MEKKLNPRMIEFLEKYKYDVRNNQENRYSDEPYNDYYDDRYDDRYHDYDDCR